MAFGIWPIHIGGYLHTPLTGPTTVLLSAQYLSIWRKRSVVFGVLAMVIGAALAFATGVPATSLYRMALGMDVVVMAALAVLFVRLTRPGSALG